MSRAHFAYPLVRTIDGDAGGAADLQTDIMRFMAILALCLLAIFALVQSLPPVPAAVPEEAPEAPVVEAEPERVPEPVRVALVRPAPAKAKAPEAPPVLTRPKRPAPRAVAKAPPPTTSAPATPASVDDTPGFTLRFESDLALSRLVATGQVGLFALDSGNAQRMSVAESRVSFWAAPVPRQFHEMDQSTVPAAVRDALERTGRKAAGTTWAVTLPARLSGELDRVMSEFQGGALVIAKDGSLRREPR